MEYLESKEVSYSMEKLSGGIMIAVATSHCWLELWDEPLWPFNFKDGGLTPFYKRMVGGIANSLYTTVNLCGMEDIESLLAKVDP